MGRARRSRLVVAAAVVLGGLAVAAPRAEAAPSSGVNNWSCRPSAAHPEPVVLLHGLGANKDLNWFFLAPKLANAGYCVFSLTYGQTWVPVSGGLASMRESAKEVRDFVDEVRSTTGAAKVSIVGHSEGSTVGSWYLKHEGGGAKVKAFVGIAPNYRGVTYFGLSTLARAVPGVTDLLLSGTCDACNEYLRPSPFLDELSAGGITVPGPTYTNIRSTYDVIVPSDSWRIDEPGVRNIVLQSECFLDASGHLSAAINPNVASRVLRALDPVGAPRPGCVPFFAPA